MWWVGDLEMRTKIIMTVVYLITLPTIFINGWLFVAAQGLFALIAGVMTFAVNR